MIRVPLNISGTGPTPMGKSHPAVERKEREASRARSYAAKHSVKPKKSVFRSVRKK